MSAVAWLGLLIPVAYLLGSVPFGLLIGRYRGIDVRTAGSGNIGASNVGRLLGKPYFYLTLALDALKGLVPTLSASSIVHVMTEPAGRTVLLHGLWVLVGLAAALGHIFPVFLKFRGGKGVAVGIGILLGIFPYATLPGLVGLALFIGLVLTTRYISVGSMLGALSVPLVYVVLGLALGWDVLGQQWPILALLVILAVLVVLRHRENISRLIAGTENKIRSSATQSGPDS